MPDSIHIGNVIRNAVVFNLQNWQGDPMNTDALLQAVPRLFTLLHERQIEYLLVGGIALLQYVKGRNTEDIDLIMTLPSLQRLPEIQIISQDVYFAQGQFSGLHLDILLTHHPLFDKVRRHYATIQRFQEQNIPCATVEGLILLKLYALPSLYRQGNFTRVGLYENDIATLLHYYHPPLEPLFDELALYLSATDLAALREIVTEIQQRIARFQKGFGESE
jgi:hypothetical protein